MLKRIAVFCGSNLGNKSVYGHHALELGRILAERRIGLVYGGAKIGMMGAVANGCLQAGGEVIGVIPHFLKSAEVVHTGLSMLIEVESMHQRKIEMHALSDGFIALPGGFGTLEELFETLTWAQLSLHQKPVAVLNVDGFYDRLLAMIETMSNTHFLRKENRDMVIVSREIPDLLDQMLHYRPPSVDKWVTKAKDKPSDTE